MPSRPKETFKTHLVSSAVFPDYLPIGYERSAPAPILRTTCKGVTRSGKACEAVATNTGFCPNHKYQVLP